MGLVEVGRAVVALVIVVRHASSAARAVAEPAARLMSFPASVLAPPLSLSRFATARIAAGAAFHGFVERPLPRILRERFLSRTTNPTRDTVSPAIELGSRDEIERAGIVPAVIANEAVASIAAPSVE